MDALSLPSSRVRWLVAGSLSRTPSGQRFLLTEDSLAGRLGRAAHGLRVPVPDRIGSGDTNSYEVSFDGLHAFQLSALIDSIPNLRALRTAQTTLSTTGSLNPEDAAHLQSSLSSGPLPAAMAEAARGARSPQQARLAVLGVLEEALFATARDILQHPWVAGPESTWRGLHWLQEHCPASSGLDIEVLDVEPSSLVATLTQCLEVSPLQRPEACFILDTFEDVEALHALAALGEQASLPIVVSVPLSLLGEGLSTATEQEARARQAWNQLRAEESSRWLCASLNPVVMLDEQQGAIRRQCFASPSLAVAALLSASFRDTRTFGRLTGPGSGTQAPAMWKPHTGSAVATEVGLSLREQQRLAAQGLLAVSGWWDSQAVMLAAAPTAYRGRDATTLPAQLLTGRLLRFAQELVERLPPAASSDTIAAAFSRAAEHFLPTASPRDCQLHAQLVSLGNRQRGVQVRASVRPELAGTHLQLAFTLPLPPVR
jgi:type VI secretion system protein ImpC